MESVDRMKQILLVCTGNTCRSSMAEYLLRDILDREGLENRYSVNSAGTSVFMSQPASSNALAALKEIGINLSPHQSQQVTEQMVNNADIVLAMTASHRNYLLKLMPEAAGKIFTLKEYCCGVYSDVSDPFGGDLEEYRRCRDEIRECLIKFVEKLKGKE